jgi:hypothetical protein
MLVVLCVSHIHMHTLVVLCVSHIHTHTLVVLCVSHIHTHTLVVLCVTHIHTYTLVLPACGHSIKLKTKCSLGDPSAFCFSCLSSYIQRHSQLVSYSSDADSHSPIGKQMSHKEQTRAKAPLGMGVVLHLGVHLHHSVHIKT